MGDVPSGVLGKRSQDAAFHQVSGRGKFWVLAGLALLPYVVIRNENLAESDTFWQVRTGLITIAQGQLPVTDPFSWTAAAKPWTLNSWGFNVLLGLAYQGAGLVGVAVISSFLIAAISVLVLYLARQLGAGPVSAGFILLAGMPLLTLYLSARPQLIDYIAVLALVILLRGVAQGDKPVWRLLAVGILTVLWVNLHAAALLGVGMAGASLCAVLLMRSMRNNRAAWLFAALLMTGFCSWANPYGAHLLAQTMQVKAESAAIVEWQPLNPADPLQAMLFVIGLIGLAFAVRRGDVILASSLAVAACGSITAMRILPIFVLLSLPLLASHASVVGYARSRQKMLACGASVFLLFGTGAAAYNLPFFGRPDPNRFPTEAIRAIPPGCKLFNEYDLGGFVILERPDVRVSIDSRNDLYGAEMVERSGQVIAGEVTGDEGTVGADCVLVSQTSGLADHLRNSSTWETRYAESSAVLFVRR